MSEAKVEAKVPNVLIVYYSMYKHIETMAAAVAKGVEAGGGKVTVMRAPETLSAEVLKKLGAPPKNEEHKECGSKDLAAADAIIFGIPTRFGMAAAQMKALLDRTGGLWMKGGLLGKPAGIFVSTGTLGGGQETTALTFITQLTHHGMMFVPIGYGCQKLTDLTEVHGGSPYGAGTLAGGDGSRKPSKLELEIAEYQGSYMAKVAKKYVA
eukprot:CAMPEP_0197518802 /NCGR_PEP_ID=MMETSP1318-20131121/4042_1 /TAXON_ID=552666 /ORGANISM="Partenskyella glossopodia, Strain RCC365" /LENGTH=209 /DNA_ID=CAMNT_0043069425 /DNA_START=86 /DNA_END=715 /DNA_ORIENTATION=+